MLLHPVRRINYLWRCRKDKHFFDYYTAGNRLLAVEDGHTFVDVPARTCKYCSRTEEKWCDGKWSLLE